MLTVYLDTSFYVDLDRADPDTATRVATELARMDIRPVVSNALLNELLLRDGRGDELFFKVVSLPAPGLRIPEDASWALLRLDGEERAQFTETMRRIDRTMAQVRATSIGTDRLTPAEARIIAERHNAPTEHGPESEAFRAAMFQQMLAQLEVAEEQVRGALANDESTAALLGTLGELKQILSAPFDPAQLQAQLAALMTDPRLAAVSREAAVGSTLSKNDRRAVDVALGTPVSPKMMAGLASLFRDASHMHGFLEHSDKIDYLQIDGARMSQLQRDAEHDLRLRGVESRCFAAASLEEVLAHLELLSSRPAPAR